MSGEPRRKGPARKKRWDEFSPLEQEVAKSGMGRTGYFVLMWVAGLELVGEFSRAEEGILGGVVTPGFIFSITSLIGYLGLYWAARAGVRMASLFGILISGAFAMLCLSDWALGEANGRNIRQAIYFSIALLIFIGSTRALGRLKRQGELAEAFPEAEDRLLFAVFGFLCVMVGWVMVIVMSVFAE